MSLPAITCRRTSYVMKLYVEAIGNAIRGVHGALSYVELDGICALYRNLAQRFQGWLRAVAAPRARRRRHRSGSLS
jgi:hypothetical protein